MRWMAPGLILTGMLALGGCTTDLGPTPSDLKAQWEGQNVYPQNFKSVPSQANTWLANKGMGTAWCARLGIAPVPQGYFDFPAGSMFWARGDALRPLFSAGITINDFNEEAGQTDGTFAHCLERLLALSGRKQGLQPGILQDTESPTWSSWLVGLGEEGVVAA